MDFKPIRNKLRKFSFESLTVHLLTILKEQEKETSRPSPFWHPLILLKWTLEFAGENYPPKEATRQDVIKLISSLEQLELSHPTFDLKRNGRLTKTFTILAFQQFQYQRRVWFDTFARQLTLFTELKHTYDIDNSFRDKTGLTITEFLKTLNIFWISVLNSELTKIHYSGFVTEDHISVMHSYLGQEKTDLLIDLLTVSRENIKSVLTEDRALKNYDLQIFETSFFCRKPFLLFKNNLAIPHRDILNHTINHFIYEFMKNRDYRFSVEFGDRMEKYIQLGLVENKIDFISENELRDLIGRTNRVVDFIIENNVLIEAKAIELRPIVSIDPTDKNLAQDLKENIVKAYARQMLSVANNRKLSDEYFGLIITYKDLYLGDTIDFWDQFLKAETMKIVQNENELDALPIDNLFFVDLATWDLMMQVVKTKQITIREILQKVRTERKAAKLFSLNMHLDSYEIKKFDLVYLDKHLI